MPPRQHIAPSPRVISWFPIRKRQPESCLLIHRGCDRPDIRVVPEDAEQVAVFVFADVMAHAHSDPRCNLFRIPLVLKESHPQMCILHRRFLPPELFR